MNEIQPSSGPATPIDLAHEAEFALGGMRVRPASREIVIAGKGQVLQPRVMQVLVALARHRGDVVSRDDLVTSCWGGLSVSEDSINRCIGQLRRLSEQAGSPVFSIETVARVGYRLAAVQIAPVAGEPLPAVEKAAVSIAVLPFVNMSSDPEQEYFSDGLSEELMNQLAQLKELHVAGRTSSFAFKGKTEDFHVIGDRLGVSYVLEGSVRKAGKRLRITAQLIKCADGFHLWSDSYDRELDDVFAIQDNVARAVTTALGVTLGVETARVEGGTHNVEAFDKHLRARALYYQRGWAEVLRAIEIYREVLALDPSFALAWYGLHAALVATLGAVPERTAAALKEMDEASAHVLALTPDAWWTHAMQVTRCMMQHRWSEAEAAASAALALAPASEVDALITYGTFLAHVGRSQEAVAHFMRARQADPLSLGVSGTLQLFLDVAGRRDEAQAEYRRSKDLAGDHERWKWAALLRLWARKDADPAAVEAQFRADLRPNHWALDHILVDRLGDKAAARAAIREAFDDPANKDFGRMTGIFLYADHFGDKDLALAAMRRAFVDLNKVNFEGLWWPFETGLRADPRFKEIVRDIGLVDYWRASGKWGDFARPLGTDDFECW